MAIPLWRSLVSASRHCSKLYEVPLVVSTCSYSVSLPRFGDSSKQQTSTISPSSLLFDEYAELMMKKKETRLPEGLTQIGLVLKLKFGYADNLTPELRALLHGASSRLYFDCSNRYPYKKLCELFGFKDYLATWYKLTLMHVWMVLMRLHVSLNAGAYLYLRHSILSLLWNDIDERLKIFGKEIDLTLTLKKDMKKMHGLYLQTLLEYDEGFLSSDTVLAGAIWRCLYIQREFDPVLINNVIFYMRAAVAYLDSLDIDDILVHGIKEWKVAKPVAVSPGIERVSAVG